MKVSAKQCSSKMKNPEFYVKVKIQMSQRTRGGGANKGKRLQHPEQQEEEQPVCYTTSQYNL